MLTGSVLYIMTIKLNVINVLVNTLIHVILLNMFLNVYICISIKVSLFVFAQGMSVVASGPCVETRPSTLGQSQSVMNISKMSPKVELKKRRAPAPPPAPTQTVPPTSQV